MRVNEVLERHIKNRQQSGQDLFETIYFNYTFDPHERILNNAENLALFNAPTNFSNINTINENEALSYWILVIFIGIGIIIGLFMALNSAKKRRRANGIH